MARWAMTLLAKQIQHESFPKLGVPFAGPKNEEYSILGLHWASPILGEYHTLSRALRAFWAPGYTDCLQPHHLEKSLCFWG